MKKFSQFQKVISLLMIFLLLLQLSGCYNYKVISMSEQPLPDSIKYSYIVHSQNSKYVLENTIISYGILSGKIDTTGNYSHIKNRIHLYLTSDSVMKINAESILSVPLDGMTKIKIAKLDVVEIVLLVGVCTLGILTVVGIAKMNSGSFLNIH